MDLLVPLLRLSHNVAALWKLLRVMPVVCWGGGAVLLGAAVSARIMTTTVAWPKVMFAVFMVILLQGIAAHALNDRVDWRSGTDKSSPGILSGGSKVLKEKLLTSRQLLTWSRLSLAVGSALTCLLCYKYANPQLLIFLVVGLWAAVAYSCPPLRLSYRPLLGEWLAAWPAMTVCTVGATFLLTGTLPMLSWCAGVIHATISIGWLMQHHLPDIAADLTARPVKSTTVAYLCAHWGWSYVTIPSALYFFCVIAEGMLALPLHHGFLVSILAGLAGLILALITDPGNLSDITRKQLAMMLVSFLHFCLLSFSFVYF